ncbi:MAG TPA: hypothetical protein DCY74_07825 [Clostridiales bacterium]|jgi:hypothetical protein|nr:hypothetical protein [Clostridiales bacterium]
MKQLIISIVLLCLVIVLVVWNSLYLTHVCDEMLAMARALPENRETFDTLSPDQVEKIRNRFEDVHFSMNLSVPIHHSQVAMITILDTLSYVKVKNYDEYIAAKNRMIDALKVLLEYEIPHLTNLL